MSPGCRVCGFPMIPLPGRPGVRACVRMHGVTVGRAEGARESATRGLRPQSLKQLAEKRLERGDLLQNARSISAAPVARQRLGRGTVKFVVAAAAVKVRHDEQSLLYLGLN